MSKDLVLEKAGMEIHTEPYLTGSIRCHLAGRHGTIFAFVQGQIVGLL